MAVRGHPVALHRAAGETRFAPPARGCCIAKGGSAGNSGCCCAPVELPRKSSRCAWLQSPAEAAGCAMDCTGAQRRTAGRRLQHRKLALPSSGSRWTSHDRSQHTRERPRAATPVGTRARRRAPCLPFAHHPPHNQMPPSAPTGQVVGFGNKLRPPLRLQLRARELAKLRARSSCGRGVLAGQQAHRRCTTIDCGLAEKRVSLCRECLGRRPQPAASGSRRSWTGGTRLPTGSPHAAERENTQAGMQLCALTTFEKRHGRAWSPSRAGWRGHTELPAPGSRSRHRRAKYAPARQRAVLPHANRQRRTHGVEIVGRRALVKQHAQQVVLRCQSRPVDQGGFFPLRIRDTS